MCANWAKDATELVGRTPLVELRRVEPDLPALCCLAGDQARTASRD